MSNRRNEMLQEAIDAYAQYLADTGYEVLFVALYGSQNYGLDEYSDEYFSDIDAKAIVLPSIKDFLQGKQIESKTMELKFGQVDIKDIRVMLEMWRKANIAYLEALYSNWVWINPKYKEFLKLLQIKDDILVMNKEGLLKSIKGMAYEKKKALCHPYPTIKWKIDKWGYDGKQLSHTARLYDWIQQFEEGKSIKKCFTPTNKDILMKMKKQEGYSKEEAVMIEDFLVEEIENFINPMLEKDIVFQQDTWNKMQEISQKIMLKRIKEEMKNYE